MFNLRPLAMLLLLWLTCAAQNSRATQTITLNFEEPYVEIEVTFNDGGPFTQTWLELYYQGIAVGLSQHIAKKVAAGELEDKPFFISYWMWPRDIYEECGIQFSRSPNRYKIAVMEFTLGLPELLHYVDYFAHPDWQSFRCKDPKKYYRWSHKALNRQVNGVLGPIPDEYRERELTVWQDGPLAITLRNDSLQIRHKTTPIPIDLNDHWSTISPLRISSQQYMLADDDRIYLLENDRIVQSWKKPAPFDFPSGFKKKGNWVEYQEEGMPTANYNLKTGKFYRSQGGDNWHEVR